jgi:hypothetical protein
MSLYINSIKDSEVLSSYNFARKADIVFSEIVTKSQYEELKTSNTQIIEEDENSIFYIQSQFELKENDVIFTNTYFINILFEVLRDLNFQNIKIISSQTDHFIDKKLFYKKPEAVSYWYSINVCYKNAFLKSIPLGLANNYSPKNLNKLDYKKLKIFENKVEQIYVNFETNTNYFHRSRLKKSISKNDFYYFEKNKIDNLEYLKKLNMFKYVLTPWGNGIDSHRVWETLYAGSYPLIPKHNNFYSIFESENFLFKRFNNLSNVNLTNTFLNFEINNEILNINYWENKIRINNKPSSNCDNKLIEIKVENALSFYDKLKNKEFKQKKIKTLKRKIHNKVFNK